ncbi:hypothetical protein Trco_007077 [Trichoderma cornu-damae]|uniref:DUF221-domain-containing protein n=1 Tax=Trichoderma cornu-damae TaxID=654480 RepID=A0A9P8QLJ7_9HYPO|nr:hypothetical protein Trco_007077 [Trichoderma cornu-damae]
MGNFISWLNKLAPDSNQGSALEAQPESAWGMLDTLVPVLIVSSVYIAIFLFLRRSQRRFYAPRTYLGSLREDERTPSVPGNLLSWVSTFWKIPDAYVLTHQSLDAYLFLRYLRICFVVCVVSLAITWPILFPVNATGGKGLSQLEILSYSNVDIDKHKNHLYAHTFVGWAVYGFLMYMITRECIFYINLRQAHHINPHYAKRISARTVLFTSVPDEYNNEERIRGMLRGVRTVWVCGKTDELDELVEKRDDAAMKLEKGEIGLLTAVNKARAKALKKGGGEAEAQPQGPASATAEGGDVEAGDIASRWIPDKKRPHHRLGFLGLVGEKVDTIEWSRSELQRLVPEVQKAQADWRAGSYEKVGAVFVEFETQGDAQFAFQSVTHHQALHMEPKAIGIHPGEVLWKSLALPWWQIIIRHYAVYAFIAALIIFWAIPVGIVGLIAQVNTLKNIPGLTWIGAIPKPILGVVSGLLPAVALSVLMSLVPVVMRLCARLAGEVSQSRVELFTQNAYFFFQLVQVFLIQTLTNAASTALVQIAQQPQQVFSILSSSLPTASNFYISYFIVQGLTIATGVVTQVVGFFVFTLLYKFLAKTPRAMYKKWTSLSAISWGNVLPVYTNIAVISITYSVIAPLILFWSSIGMGLFYLAYRYNILFVTETQVDTHGLIYPRALKQLFAGIYLAEICMVGLFAVSKAAGPAVLMAIFLAFTILYHITLSRTLDPLLYGLPRSLQAEEDAIQARAAGNGTGISIEEGLASNNVSHEDAAAAGKAPGPKVALGASSKKGNFVLRFLQPWIYADYASLREWFTSEEHFAEPIQYPDDVVAEAYLPPSVSSKTPILWIPLDPAGLSKQEVAASSKVIPMTDEGAALDEKNHITWDAEGARPPIWEEKIYY